MTRRAVWSGVAGALLLSVAGVLLWRLVGERGAEEPLTPEIPASVSPSAAPLEVQSAPPAPWLEHREVPPVPAGV